MTPAYARICGRLFNQPLLYDAGKAETLVRMLGPRMAGAPLQIINGNGGVDHVAFANGRASAGMLADNLGRAFDRKGIAPFPVVDGVAVIAIEGTLVQKGSWVGADSGETSYEGLLVQITRALRSTAVRAICFEVDSYGGEVNGAFEAAAAIRAASKAKPTIAILTDFAYSAGYLLASQARQIIMPEFGGAGSIGVVMMHADFSAALEQDGIKVTFIHAGKHKVDGSSFLPLDPDLRDRWQAEVEVMRDRFAAVVGQGRGKRCTKAAALKTEANAYTAREALQLGLVDAVGDPQEAFGAFLKAANGSL